jgi:hypothetical protein
MKHIHPFPLTMAALSASLLLPACETVVVPPAPTTTTTTETTTVRNVPGPLTPYDTVTTTETTRLHPYASPTVIRTDDDDD